MLGASSLVCVREACSARPDQTGPDCFWGMRACSLASLSTLPAPQIFSNLVRKNIENFVEYVEGEPLMVKNMIGAYGNTDIALHGGAMLRECIRYENLARMTLYDETLWLFFDQVGFMDLSAMMLVLVLVFVSVAAAVLNFSLN